MEAVAKGYAHTTQVLLDHGASVNLRNASQETALTIASEAPEEARSITKRLLQEAGAKE